MKTHKDEAVLAAEPAEARSDIVSALERGLSVLRCFTPERPLLGYTEIARITGIPRPTVNRLVATLLASGMLKPAPSSDRFTLGPGVLSLARVFLGSLDVRAAARPLMQAMAEDMGASVYLGCPRWAAPIWQRSTKPIAINKLRNVIAPRLRATALRIAADIGGRVPPLQP